MNDMKIIKFDPSTSLGKFKVLNAVGGGPWYKRHALNDQQKTNFADYKAARIPYSRNHDLNGCSIYGGPYAHDITAIFPNFDADPTDPASYDFACTDEDILATLEAGTETFYRLGQTIEHQIKKHGTLPPRDFHKWAVICEHLIRHLCGDFADGLGLDMHYFEIWNEPDMCPDDHPDKRTWGGTKAEFFDFYEIAAKHLKKCFPNLKIGGPAVVGGNYGWINDFLSEMHRRDVPIDFFSWHIYCRTPAEMMKRARDMREMLDRNGYKDTESILNEWNYIKNWSDGYVESLKTIHSMKGAAFMMACMSEAQSSSIDMLMYYDARPSCFNGMFDYYTAERLKGYYPIYWYGDFYDCTKQIACVDCPKDIYTLCGTRPDGKLTAAVTYYTDDPAAEPMNIAVDLDGDRECEVYLLDARHDGERVAMPTRLEPNSVLFIKEI